MYAIIRTGGKQFTVKPGDVVQVPKLAFDLGSEHEISEVLLLGGDNALVGEPMVKDAKVTVVITKQGKTRKIDVFKKKRRQSYRNWNTHRQEFTEIFVKSITAPGGKVTKAEGEAKVVDVVQNRIDRIANKQTAARARREDKETRSTMKKPGVAKKATAAKKKAAKKVAKKASGKKGVTKKKVAKKAAKKTTKK